MRTETSDSLDLVRYGFERGAEAQKCEFFAALAVFYLVMALMVGVWLLHREATPLLSSAPPRRRGGFSPRPAASRGGLSPRSHDGR